MAYPRIAPVAAYSKPTVSNDAILARKSAGFFLNKIGL